MSKLTKDDLVGKCLQIESWAYRMRHLIESQSEKSDKLVLCCKRIRADLEDLEVALGIE